MTIKASFDNLFVFLLIQSYEIARMNDAIHKANLLHGHFQDLASQHDKRFAFVDIFSHQRSYRENTKRLIDAS